MGQLKKGSLELIKELGRQLAETTVELEKQGIRPITVYNPKTNKDDLKFIKRR